MRKKIRKKKKLNMNKKTLIRYAFSGIVVLALLIVVTYAWFATRVNLATLVEVKGPTAIAIHGPHGIAQEALDMSYTDDDVDENGKVTIRRVVSISSDISEHQLEIVHTTNLKELNFKLYKATEVETTDVGAGYVTEKNYTYTYNPDAPIDGSYVNLEKTKDGYRFANKSMHQSNFDEYTNVQSHAEPLYWITNANQESVRNTNNANVDTKYLTYYILEISWEETTKETDIFYLLAKNK